MTPAARIEISRLELGVVTLPEWHPRAADGECTIDGFVAPGHQSLVVSDDAGGCEVLVGQCSYSCAEFVSGEPSPLDQHGPESIDAGLASLERLRSLRPGVAHLAHDREVVRLT